VELKCDVLSLTVTGPADWRQTKGESDRHQWKTCTSVAAGEEMNERVSLTFHIHVLGMFRPQASATTRTIRWKTASGTASESAWRIPTTLLAHARNTSTS